MAARRRNSDSRIFFPWERRRPRFAWLSRRGLGGAVLAGLVGLVCYVLVRVEARRAAAHATRAAITDVMRAVESFRADHEGRCPADVAELLSPGGGQVPYLARTPRDGWGRALRMSCPGRKNPRSADVTSGGPSGTFEDLDQMD